MIVSHVSYVSILSCGLLTWTKCDTGGSNGLEDNIVYHWSLGFHLSLFKVTATVDETLHLPFSNLFVSFSQCPSCKICLEYIDILTPRLALGCQFSVVCVYSV